MRIFTILRIISKNCEYFARANGTFVPAGDWGGVERRSMSRSIDSANIRALAGSIYTEFRCC